MERRIPICRPRLCVAAGAMAADRNPPFHRVWRWRHGVRSCALPEFFNILATVGDGGIWGNFADFFEYAWWFRGKFVTL